MASFTSAAIADINDPVALELARVEAIQRAANNLAMVAWRESTRLGASLGALDLSGTTVMCWKTGQDSTCKYVCDLWCAWRGRTKDQELGLGWADGIHPDDIVSLMSTYLEAFEHRRAFCMQFRMRHRSGEYHHVRCVGFPQYERGHFVGYIGMTQALHQEELRSCAV